MLTITRRAAAVLKAAKAAEGAADRAGIRLRAGAPLYDSGVSVGFAITDAPAPKDMELEQDGLRIFIEDVLVEPLDGRTLDVRDAADSMELIFR
ncbi:MAG TPA: hypothetical protein VKT99_04960 [Xanthobacteraceae bacterium]|nr:hypothetical protein [Xanthobacteraceae bacterium]